MSTEPVYQQPNYLPTRDEIEAKCEAFQQNWTAREERRRRLWSAPLPVEVTTIDRFLVQMPRPAID